MTEPNPTSVECPVCGEAFDPTAAGGWCTNSECGEWKYEGEVVPDPDDSVATNHDDHVPLDAITGSASDVPTGEDEPRENGEADRIREPAGSSDGVGERSSEGQGSETRGSEAQGSETRGSEAQGSETQESEADVAGEPEEPRVAVGENEPVGGGPGESEPVEDEQVENEPGENEPGESEPGESDAETGSSESGGEPEGDADPAGSEGTEAGSSQNEIEDRLDAIDDRLEDVDDSAAGDDDDEDDGETTIECPDCGETLYEENFFIHDCSADATGEPSADAAGDESGEAPAEASADTREQPGADAPDETGAPAGGESSADSSGTSSPSAECPTCGEAVEPDVNFCPNCGEDMKRHQQDGDAADSGGRGGDGGVEEGTASDTAGGRHPENLVLRARGREVTVSDGDAVGREFRRILTRTGGDEDDAVRIHRKHVRFVREGGEFDLIDLGENPTAVNGRTLEKGDRRPVGPGDTITLSNVLTAEVEAP